MVEALSSSEPLQYQKGYGRQKSQEAQKLLRLLCLFVGSFYFWGLGLLVRSAAAAVLFRTLLIGVLRRRPLVFPVVSYDLRRFLGRPFIMVFALRKCPGGDHAEHRYNQ